MSRRVTRKEFLKMAAATGASVVTSNAMTVSGFAASGFTTLAEDRGFAHPGAPQLFGATGLAASTRRLEAEGITHLNVLAPAHSGHFLQAWMFGGHVSQAIFRSSTIELTLDSLNGYHFVELDFRPLYPFDFFDLSGVFIEGPIAPGAISTRHAVPRLATLQLPKIVLRVQATFNGNPVSGFYLHLPGFRAIQG
jgi:hypothetical protein